MRKQAIQQQAESVLYMDNMEESDSAEANLMYSIYSSLKAFNEFTIYYASINWLII